MRAARGLLSWLPALAILAGCGGTSAAHTAPALTASSASAGAASTTSRSATAAARKPNHTLVDHYPGALTAHWQVISRVGGRPALWVEQRDGVTMVRIDQKLAHLALHAGAAEPGGTGWRYGPEIAGRERRAVILGVNGGFKFATGAGGFYSAGRTGQALVAGRGSIVTYRSGVTDIGAWHAGVPARGRQVFSVRQNLSLLIDGGRAAADVASCGSACWGATLGGGASVARSGMGIQRNGRLIWAAGSSLTPGRLAGAMVGVGVVRAVELDINPEWVAGYLYLHPRHGAPHPIPVVPGQFGIAGALLTPYGRDFLTIDSNV